MYERYAEQNADLASGRQGEAQLTDAIGEGLAAVAYAILELASAVRSASDQLGAIASAQSQR